LSTKVIEYTAIAQLLQYHCFQAKKTILNKIGKRPMQNQSREASPCPECGTPRLLLDKTVEFWITGMHENKYDPSALVCPRCGSIAFYASPAALSKIVQVVQAKAAKQAAADAQAQANALLGPKKKGLFG
jgi:DNA-directed RNA polymerase subunit RPC12/RpoP